MATFVTVNWSGKYVIKPKTPISKDAAGNTVFREEIAFRPVRLGKDSESGNVVGIVVTDKLPRSTEKACEAWWGKDWKKILDEELQNGPANLRKLEEGETIQIDGIDMEPLDPSDTRRLPKQRRATVLQGPLTASTVLGDVQEKSVKITTKKAPVAPPEAEKDDS